MLQGCRGFWCPSSVIKINNIKNTFSSLSLSLSQCCYLQYTFFVYLFIYLFSSYRVLCFEVLGVPSLVCCNRECNSGLSSKGEFSSSFFSLNSFVYCCEIYGTNVQFERTCKDLPKAYLKYKRPSSLFSKEKIFWENSDT